MIPPRQPELTWTEGSKLIASSHDVGGNQATKEPKPIGLDAPLAQPSIKSRQSMESTHSRGSAGSVRSFRSTSSNVVASSFSPSEYAFPPYGAYSEDARLVRKPSSSIEIPKQAPQYRSSDRARAVASIGTRPLASSASGPIAKTRARTSSKSSALSSPTPRKVFSFRRTILELFTRPWRHRQQRQAQKSRTRG